MHMWGLVGARLAGTGREATEVPRRTAVVLFPAIVLLHTIFVRALAPELQKANLYAAGVALVCGIAFRWLRHATAVVAIISLFTAVTFIYMFGIAAPLSYLVVSGRSDWLLWAAPTCIGSFGLLLLVRVLASIKWDWSRPLEETPGVQIATQDWILWREFGAETQRFNVTAAVLGVAVIVAFGFLRGTPQELVLVMGIGPICLALLMTDPVARLFGFYIAVRRWEAQHKIQLRVPRLAPRGRKQRGRSASKGRG